MFSVTKQYQILNNERDNISQKLNQIEDQFIRTETPTLKQRMLAVYNKVAPSRINELTNILNNISYGPVKIASVPLIDNGFQRFGSVLYYKFKESCGLFETPVLFVTYKSASGKTVTQLYALTIEPDDHPCQLDEVIPPYWTTGMSLIDREPGPDGYRECEQLLAFLGDNKDLGEFGDIYGAIPEYYDIQEKLRTGEEYFWVNGEHPIAPPNRSQIIEELRDVTEGYSSYNVHDLTSNDWEMIQGLLQKAFIALQT